MKYKIFLFILGTLFIFGIVNNVNAVWLQGWSNRVNITINSSMNTWIGFSENVTWNSNMSSNFNDLRYVDNNNNILPYCIYNKVNSSWAQVYVNVSTVTANNNITISRYFNNVSAISGENCGNTFYFINNPLHNATWTTGTSGAYSNNENAINVFTTFPSAYSPIKNDTNNIKIESTVQDAGSSVASEIRILLMNETTTSTGVGYAIDFDSPLSAGNAYLYAMETSGSKATTIATSNTGFQSVYRNYTAVQNSTGGWSFYTYDGSLAGTGQNNSFNNLSYIHIFNPRGGSNTVRANNISMSRYGDRAEIYSLSALETNNSAPSFYTNVSSKPSIYSSSTISQFNITCIDDLDIICNKALFEINNTGSFINNTAFALNNSLWTFNFSSLNAGTYGYRWYMNDSFNFFNSTPQVFFTISKGIGSISQFYFNNTNVTISGTKFIGNKSIVNFTATINTSGVNPTISQQGNLTFNLTNGGSGTTFSNVTTISNTTSQLFNVTFCVDTNANWTGTCTSRFLSLDLDAPSFASQIPVTGASSTYGGSSGTYQFNITITDPNTTNTASGISKVMIENNFGGTLVNTSITTNQSNVYYITFVGTSQGSYSYRWWANDSVDPNEAFSSSSSFTITASSQTGGGGGGGGGSSPSVNTSTLYAIGDGKCEPDKGEDISTSIDCINYKSSSLQSQSPIQIPKVASFYAFTIASSIAGIVYFQQNKKARKRFKASNLKTGGI